jgi:predicted secreted protein with PEFG-CTERM motif
MDYKAYALMTILLASVALVAPIETTYAATSANTTTGAATTNATGGQLRTFNLKVGGQTRPIQYMINGGSVENMTISSQNSTLTVSINSIGNGTLVVKLPRNLIDAKTSNGSDTTFDALIDNAEYVEPAEMERTSDMRTESVSFPAGSGAIDILGTVVIPEFSTIAVLVLAVAIVGIIIATARHDKFNFAPRL